MINLQTLPQATSQEVFDQVLAHARKQGAKSTKDGGCFYRNDQGLACFAGCLISNEEYDPEMDYNGEDNSWDTMVELEYAPNVHFDLIKSLQCIHDDFPVEQWEDQFSLLAEYENLEYKEPLNG